MNPELASDLDAIKSNTNRNPVEEMIFSAIQKFEATWWINKSEEQKLTGIFIRYKLLQLTQSKRIHKTLVTYLTTLWIKELSTRVDHTSTEKIVSTTVEERNKAVPLRENEVLKLLSQLQRLPNLQKLPKFLSYEEFVWSDFFTEVYQVWDIEDVIQFSKEEWNFTRLTWDGNKKIAKLQMMLISLWHMKQDDLLWKLHISEWESQTIHFWWLWWQKTFAAIERSQAAIWVKPDRMVGSETKQALYSEVYETFHKKVLQHIAKVWE